MMLFSSRKRRPQGRRLRCRPNILLEQGLEDRGRRNEPVIPADRQAADAVRHSPVGPDERWSAPTVSLMPSAVDPSTTG
jgi:hypothetical protein